VTDEGEDQSPANRYIIISPDHDLGTIDVRSAEICEIMEVVRKSPDWEFLLFTANLEQMNDLASILPPNCWLGFIAESGDDYVKAQNQMAVLNGIRRLLVLRPTGDSSEWVIVEKAQFCDWLAIEFAYTGPTRRARMNGEVVLRVKAYAEARSIPCYIDPELVVFLPWVQEYPPAN
jgi:protein gp37